MIAHTIRVVMWGVLERGSNGGWLLVDMYETRRLALEAAQQPMAEYKRDMSFAKRWSGVVVCTRERPPARRVARFDCAAKLTNARRG